MSIPGRGYNRAAEEQFVCFADKGLATKGHEKTRKNTGHG